ncbi:hypothetical protein [Acinetobacter defluvii]|uniref:hypothetical protein n=1 Tax=Acinetobacter TaxID=469 RepID=UPI001490278F|nr:hypothetical protein [Acinetobacter defluvii]
MEKPESLLEARNRVIQAQREAAKNPDHPINDELKAHFEERKRKLVDIQKSKVK